MSSPSSSLNPSRSTADLVVESAMQLFSRYGYRRTSMVDIAREAGLAKATLYLHYEGKEDVLRAVQERMIDAVTRRCDEAEAAPVPFRERLHRMIDARFGAAFEVFNDHDSLPELKKAWPTAGGERLIAHEAEYRARLAKMIATAEQSGEITLARCGLTPEAIIRLLVSNAVGAKWDRELSKSVPAYRAHLADLASLIAAAVER
ncbi:TetR/AcrR family transcriptional regulator [Singulisphaera sp. PoT]|uniref:TetR/AcrR family transcriptional regulator n=1 Tax=Singulisphaera sp. PoT TaxID=3411797 RepID=UPI003BF488A9